jgi:hypothetical protein
MRHGRLNVVFVRMGAERNASDRYLKFNLASSSPI